MAYRKRQLQKIETNYETRKTREKEKKQMKKSNNYKSNNDKSNNDDQ